MHPKDESNEPTSDDEAVRSERRKPASPGMSEKQSSAEIDKRALVARTLDLPVYFDSDEHADNQLSNPPKQESDTTPMVARTLDLPVYLDSDEYAGNQLSSPPKTESDTTPLVARTLDSPVYLGFNEAAPHSPATSLNTNLKSQSVSPQARRGLEQLNNDLRFNSARQSSRPVSGRLGDTLTLTNSGTGRLPDVPSLQSNIMPAPPRTPKPQANAAALSASNNAPPPHSPAAPPGTLPISSGHAQPPFPGTYETTQPGMPVLPVSPAARPAANPVTVPHTLYQPRTAQPLPSANNRLQPGIAQPPAPVLPGTAQAPAPVVQPGTAQPLPPVPKLTAPSLPAATKLQHGVPPSTPAIAKLLANFRPAAPSTAKPRPDVVSSPFTPESRPETSPATSVNPQLQSDTGPLTVNTPKPRRQRDVADTFKFEVDSLDQSQSTLAEAAGIRPTSPPAPVSQSDTTPLTIPKSDQKSLVARTLSLPNFLDLQEHQESSSDTRLTELPNDLPELATASDVIPATARQELHLPRKPQSPAQKGQAPTPKGRIARTLSLLPIFGMQERLTGDGLSESSIEFSGEKTEGPGKKRQVAITLSLPVLFGSAADTLTSAAETLTSAAAAINPEAFANDTASEEAEKSAVGSKKKRRVAKTLSLPDLFTSAAQTFSAAAENLNQVAENLGGMPKPKREHDILHVGPRPGSLTRPIADGANLAPDYFELDPERDHSLIAKLFHSIVRQIVISHNAKLSQPNDQSQRGSPYVWLVLLLVGVCILYSYVQFDEHSPSKLEKPIEIALKGAHLESCDQRCSINFTSDSLCEIKEPGTSISAAYSVVSNAADPFAFLKGYLGKREIWYHYDPSGLIEHNGVVLYPTDSPESMIVRKMRWYANFAQQQYRDTKLYPSDAEQCKESDAQYGYTNPFTHQTDYAPIILQKLPGDAIDLTNQLTTDRQYRPGAIICQCVNNKIFVVQGFDRSGKLLTSSAPGHFFYIECRNGDTVAIPETDKKNQSSHTANENPPQVLICTSKELESYVHWLRRGCQIFLWSTCVIALLFCYLSHKTAKSLKVRIVSIISCLAAVLLLSVWYNFAGWRY